MERKRGSPAGAVLERTRTRRGSAWEVGGLAAALAAAVALWMGVVAGIAAPLGGALARLEPPPAAPPACATPPDAMASARPARAARSCP